MKGSSYRERDYAFVQVMLTVRTRLGLTQIELADRLGVTRRAVIDWEGGLSYPSVDHLKRFVVLAVERPDDADYLEFVEGIVRAGAKHDCPVTLSLAARLHRERRAGQNRVFLQPTPARRRPRLEVVCAPLVGMWPRVLADSGV